jgi:hypothetical protein
MVSFNRFVTMKAKIKMAAGGHLHFDNGCMFLELKKFHTEQIDVGLVSIGQAVQKLPHFFCFSLIPFYGWEIEGWKN